MSENKGEAFKVCTMCGYRWETRDDLLDDLEVTLNGYQADFEDLEHGLFMFTHHCQGCGSTVALLAEDFIDLNPAPRHPRRKTGTASCPGFCLDSENLAPCDQACECNFVRQLIAIIEERKLAHQDA